MSWERPFDQPVPLPGGPSARTLRDAGNYIKKLPRSDRDTPEWRLAIQMLIDAAEERGFWAGTFLGFLLKSSGVVSFFVSASAQFNTRESLMSRAVFFGTLLFVGPFVSVSWGQNKTEPPRLRPAFPGGSNITFQWDYSCTSGKYCSFSCPGSGGARHVTKLNILLGTIPVGSNQAPAVFYEFSTREIPRGNGFSISAGLSTLSCQVNGMTLDYYGPR